ncbi:MFS transporter [Streptomyces luteolus]|uniref:MFS transporter n=1 Tax=Streptomyces luteolus TaxID=3043615 RepID=A0ABT6T7H8_9ACTN|nr:MFS transporter [Streptomyces sp. B-S-A12]MDI3423825.1 MFS transporter [Streptomyces sp. B-S-A12]
MTTQGLPADTRSDDGPAAPHGGRPSPWRDRRFRIFAAGNVANNIGEAVYAVALPLFVYERTGSLAVMSFLAVLTPATLLLAPLLGAIVDRHGARVLVVPGLLVQAAAAVALNLTGLAPQAPVWPLFVFGALVQIGGAAYRTGWMTGVAHMFPDNPVRSRASLGSLYTITNVIGPLLVSAALLWIGYAGLLWLNVITFFAPIVVWLIGVHPPRLRAPASGGGMGRQLADGVRTLRATPVLLHAMLVFVPMLLVGTTGTMALSLFRLQDEWKLSAQTVGLILVAVRIAGVLGTVLVAERKTFPFRTIVLAGTIGMGTALLVMASGSVHVFVAAMVAMVGFQAALAVASDLMVFHFVPADALGRIGGIVDLALGIPVLAAPLIIPALSTALGASASFLILGALQLTGLLWLWHTWRQWSPNAVHPPDRMASAMA